MTLQKPAKTTFDINEPAKNRWSPRAFDKRPVEKEKMQRLFEAARLSPSASNEQPWHFMIGMHGDPTWNKIFELLAPGNKVWNENMPVLLLCIGREVTLKNQSEYAWYAYDCGQSVAHLSIEAMNQGLMVHQMAGFDAEKAVSVFDLPAHYKPLTAIAIGYAGDPEQLPENLKERELAERTRKEFDSFVFSDTFGKSSGLF
jgi:nitroreductase